MSFVSSYATDEVLQKYHLIERVAKHTGVSLIRDEQRNSWVGDSDLGAFLFLVKGVGEIGRSDRREPTNTHVYLFNTGSVEYSVTLRKTFDRDVNNKRTAVVWALLEVEFDGQNKILTEGETELLKEALIEFKTIGYRSPLPTIATKFEF